MISGDGLKIRVFDDEESLAEAAAVQASEVLRRAIAAKRTARMLATTGGSHRRFLTALTQQPGIAWGEVELFHHNEYVGLSGAHPGSIRRHLHEQLISKARPGRYHLLEGLHEPERACQIEGGQLAQAPIDVAFVGMGENGSLGFNGPPADFQTETPYLLVRLDEACRRAQAVDDGFASLAEVPERAISISIRQLLKARTLLCLVPEPGKADAVKRCLEGSVSPLAPASVLQTHPDVTVYLSGASAARLTRSNP